MRALLADAGPLYAIADESDALHERATQELRHLELDAREVLVMYPILLETYSSLSDGEQGGCQMAYVYGRCNLS
jgi:predicted nucleic acid-binding protein